MNVVIALLVRQLYQIHKHAHHKLPEEYNLSLHKSAIITEHNGGIIVLKFSHHKNLHGRSQVQTKAANPLSFQRKITSRVWMTAIIACSVSHSALSSTTRFPKRKYHLVRTLFGAYG